MVGYGTGDVIRELDDENRRLKKAMAQIVGDDAQGFMRQLDATLDGMEVIRGKLCAYVNPYNGAISHRCDCKFGVTPEKTGGGSERGNGCPEIAHARSILMALKGALVSGRVCNRKACDNINARFWNKHTRAYYCQPCARRINEANYEEVCVLEGENAGDDAQDDE